jgi:hypothetical protein
MIPQCFESIAIALTHRDEKLRITWKANQQNFSIRQ